MTTDALILSALIVAFVVWRYFAHTRCVSCRSRRTFNWREETRDISHPKTTHHNHSQYCFQCRRVTVDDAFARIQGPRALIAEMHGGKRIRQRGLAH